MGILRTYLFFLLLFPLSLFSNIECPYGCGTICDANYQNAVTALETAIEYAGFMREQPLYSDGYRGYTFPCLRLEEKDNTISGSWGTISWWREYGSDSCTVWMENDESDDNYYYENIEAYQYSRFVAIPNPLSTGKRLADKEEDFTYPGYIPILRAFTALKEDINLVYQNSMEFYTRSFIELKNFNHLEQLPFYSYQYKKTGWDSFCRYITEWHYTQPIDQYKKQTRICIKNYISEVKTDHKRILKQASEQEALALKLSKESIDFCLKHHGNPRTHFERGAISFLEGRNLDALEHVYKAINLGIDLNSLGNEAVLMKAQAESELGLYARAVESLTHLIQKDPSNKKAYFERASAYFEVGDFDLGLEDYLASDFSSHPPELKESIFFARGLFTGAAQGSALAIAHFGETLWAFADHPIQVSQELVDSVCNCMEFLIETSFNEKKELLATAMVEELQDLCKEWPTLSSEERGAKTGFVLGKYGINLFGGKWAIRGVQAFKELKKANSLLTFEASVASEQNRLKILAQAKASSETRKKACLTIEMDKQGKHIVGHRNYQPGVSRSILEHKNPQELINNHAGTGFRECGVIGEAGYQEIVNCKEFIGYNVVLETGEKIPTTWGKIHYSSKGVHIVPTRPRELL